MARMEKLIEGWTPLELSVFSTKEQTRQTDNYFLDSSDKIHFFLWVVSLPDLKPLACCPLTVCYTSSI